MRSGWLEKLISGKLPHPALRYEYSYSGTGNNAFLKLKCVAGWLVIVDKFSCLFNCLCRGLDETLEKAIRKYLSARGISASLYNPLLEYMRSKDDKEYVVWLKNLKEFVAK